jgi:hypothetical protein
MGRSSVKKLVLIGVAMVAIATLLLAAAACEDDDGDGDATPTTGATEPSGTESEGATVEVDLSEFIVRVDPASAPAGSVTFNVNNVGGEVHEFVVVKTDLAPDALPTAADGSVDEAGEGSEVIDEIEDIQPGASEVLALDLDAGAYVLLCNIVEEAEDGTTESHYVEGMHAPFVVQ